MHIMPISKKLIDFLLQCEFDPWSWVTNHVVGGDDGNSKPALGESWKSVPHVRLLLSRDCGGKVCNMSIIKHPAMASGRTATSIRLFV
ncbi:DNA repair protein RAD51 4-like [Trifolium medium]|uniref:DNA repair protein RAD51 4-like n=1 Tax=Trifolium medium TaxID=97028 RepID=A0A392M0B0_9FABA|nr:DNA repair protein RAD51 4-like [Trifolium medium]